MVVTPIEFLEYYHYMFKGLRPTTATNEIVDSDAKIRMRHFHAGYPLTQAVLSVDNVRARLEEVMEDPNQLFTFARYMNFVKSKDHAFLWLLVDFEPSCTIRCLEARYDAEFGEANLSSASVIPDESVELARRVKRKPYLVFNVSLKGYENNEEWFHANIVFINRRQRSIELYEPNGELFQTKHLNESRHLECKKQIIELLRSRFSLEGFKVRGYNKLPRRGCQTTYTKENVIDRAVNGYCQTHVLFMIEMKVLNPSVSMSRLERVVQRVYKGQDQLAFIREYFLYVYNLEYKLLRALHDVIGARRMKSLTTKQMHRMCTEIFCAKVWRHEPVTKEDIEPVRPHGRQRVI